LATSGSLVFLFFGQYILVVDWFSGRKMMLDPFNLSPLEGFGLFVGIWACVWLIFAVWFGSKYE